MPRSFACLHNHIIFSTKYRTSWITTDIEERLYEYIGGILRAEKCVLVAAGGMPDHIHLLVSLSREISIAEVVRMVKSNSSSWIHDSFPNLRDFAWQIGYGAFAVSYSNVKDVKNYFA